MSATYLAAPVRAQLGNLLPRKSGRIAQASRTSLAWSPGLSRARFSTNKVLFDRPPGTSQPKPGKHDAPEPKMPAITFKSLGIGKNMKVFLIVVLSIFATIETWVWCKAIWWWWKGDDDAGDPRDTSK